MEVADEDHFLRSRILELTNTIPPFILHEAGVVAVRGFTEIASKARKTAENHNSSVGKLREAYASIRGYYKE